MPHVLGTAAGYVFQEWLRGQVRSRDKAPRFPESAEEVEAYRRAVRRALERAAGPVPQYDPLEAEIHQVHARDGYRIEAVSFPTFGGLRMTANAYVPDADGPVPGVLAVHGHTQHGRRDPQNQRRCIALAKAGYFVLAVDAIGNGERSVQLPGSYHGGNLAGALWLGGYSLFGIQIHENVRACDYLASRPEVDATRLAISGASGGGNQSFYSGAWDERFVAVVPVCSAGAYRKFVGSFNCMCETPFGIAGALEQYDLMAGMAPRALLVISAKADSVSFRFEDARATMDQARRLWELLGCPEKVAFAALAESHGYPRSARELCLGWFNRWLKGAGSAEPVEEPEVRIEDYATLSCYPGAAVSAVKTLPAFFVEQRERVLARKRSVAVQDVREVLSVPGVPALEVEPVDRLLVPVPGVAGASHVFRGDGILVPALAYWPDYRCETDRALVMVGNAKEELSSSRLARQALEQGISVWAMDLPGLGEAKLPGEITERVADLLHIRGAISAARACYLLGFSLSGHWIAVLNALARTLRERGSQVTLAASGGPATTVLVGASLLDSVDRLLIYNPLASYRLGDQFVDIPFEALIPDVLSAGDIPDLAALAAPKPMAVVAPIAHDGTCLPVGEVLRIFDPVVEAYEALGRRHAFHLLGPAEEETASLLDLID